MKNRLILASIILLLSSNQAIAQTYRSDADKSSKQTSSNGQTNYSLNSPNYGLELSSTSLEERYKQLEKVLKELGPTEKGKKLFDNLSNDDKELMKLGPQEFRRRNEYNQKLKEGQKKADEANERNAAKTSPFHVRHFEITKSLRDLGPEKGKEYFNKLSEDDKKLLKVGPDVIKREADLKEGQKKADEMNLKNAIKNR